MSELGRTSALLISLEVNGEAITLPVEARQTLVDFLRYGLGLTGSHVGCEHGICGACHVRVNGLVIRGCLMLAVQADGAKVETIEGLTASQEIEDLQRAFVCRNAMQCGFCTPGMLMIGADLVAKRRELSRGEIRSALSGSYCRCTGYQSIVDAIEEVARQRVAATRE